MNIVIVGTHQTPVPSPAHTGHIVYLDLAIALQQLGHDVTMIAPPGTAFPSVASMNCSHGTASPTAEYCEKVALEVHRPLLDAADVIHDWSCEKHIAEAYPGKSVSTVMSGMFSYPRHGRNVVVWSEEMRGRALRGASDYEGTEFSQWHSVSRPLKDVRVAHGGVDTEFWTPGEAPKEEFFLWLGRFHPARGYSLAIELAKRTGIELVMSGERPEDALNDHQRECALEAVRLAEGASNIRFSWLPKENHREAVREMYRRARAYLFTPLFREPFGLSQVEAMACGTPVIGTNMGSVSEVSGLANGFIIGAPHIESLAAAVAVHAGPSGNERAGAVSRFDRTVMAKRYVALYEEALKGGWG